jgi:hypothetical protein
MQTSKRFCLVAEFEEMITVCLELKMLRYILLVKQEAEHSTQTDNLLSSLMLFHIVCEIADVV